MGADELKPSGTGGVDPDRVRAGDPRSVARAISLAENRPKSASRLVAELFPHTGKARTLGVTGSPGAGKSTLTERLARTYLEAGHRVGVLAVDPSSPFTGGALLGDRVRMQNLSTDPRFFARSLASRGRMGGLSAAVADAVVILDAAGYDRILVETVGVGQDEVEVARIVDVTLLVLVPGMGDEIQAIKAGVMEIADIFVVNKADHEGADRLVRQLQAFGGGGRRGVHPRVVCTVAIRGEGLDELNENIRSLEEELGEAGLRTRRGEAERQRVLELARERLWRRLTESVPESWWAERIADLVDRRTGPSAVADELLDRLAEGKSSW